LLLNADFDGACNRAYYAMFDAARAALLSDSEQPQEIPRSHNGLIAAFSLRFVKPGRIPVEIGRALNRVEEIRMMAGYKGESIDSEHAAWAVGQAGTFVATIARVFFPAKRE